MSALAEMAKGRLRIKRSELEQALRSTLLEHRAFMITQHLSHLDFLEEQLAAFDTQIETMIQASGQPTSDPPLGERAATTDVAAEAPAATPPMDLPVDGGAHAM